MSKLDGNAIAGTMRAVFGKEMTLVVGTCRECGWAAPLAEVAVFLAGDPGVVARCPGCGRLLMVIVDRRGTACVDVSGFASLDPPRSALR
jgi:hypothetical protein